MSREMPSPEEIAQIQKEQGADSVFDEQGRPRSFEIPPEIREQMEKVEKVKDLETYIRMNKEILLSEEDPEINKEFSALLKDKIGSYFGLEAHHDRNGEYDPQKYRGVPVFGRFYYIDSEGRVSQCNFKTKDIEEYDKTYATQAFSFMEEEERLRKDLDKLGFKHIVGGLDEPEEKENLYTIISPIMSAIEGKKKRLTKEVEKKETEKPKKKKFDF